jgi:glycosyltransferase involved in cell wall biosynthesis
MKTTFAILGTVGIPAKYGGFETLAENLVDFHRRNALLGRIVVYCSSKNSPSDRRSYLGAELRYINLNANGPASVLYDAISLLSAIRRGCDVILLLGVSGALALPLVRLLSKARIVTNVDGIEWKRAKWKGFAKWWLRQSERWAVRYSHEVIADNEGIAAHINECYGRNASVIAYGGDHALEAVERPYPGSPLPSAYALALCRIEPENNVEMILQAFSGKPLVPLVFIGNWSNSAFGRELKSRFRDDPGVRLMDPIYEPGVLRTLRSGAAVYVHGHSAGGTNPSLVEMMHFGLPVLAFDCIFNRFTTNDRAIFFRSADDLRRELGELSSEEGKRIGEAMAQIARERYSWEAIGRAYFDVMVSGPNGVSHR